MKEEDRRRICEGFQEIERDLAFEVLEAWQGRRLDEFAGALVSLRLIGEITLDLCK